MKMTSININDCTQSEIVKLKITGIRIFSLRIKAGILFLKIAAKLLPFSTEIEIVK